MSTTILLYLAVSCVVTAFIAAARRSWDTFNILLAIGAGAVFALFYRLFL